MVQQFVYACALIINVRSKMKELVSFKFVLLKSAGIGDFYQGLG
jgi:hypothetical protein